MTNLTDEYNKQATDFLKKYGIDFKAVKSSSCMDCPPWCKDDRHIHGKKYAVKFTRAGKPAFRLSFWNSFAAVNRGEGLAAYDVLAVLQKYDPGTLKDFADELGYELLIESPTGRMVKNHDTICTYRAVTEEYNRVIAFFTEEELEELKGIR